MSLFPAMRLVLWLVYVFHQRVFFVFVILVLKSKFIQYLALYIVADILFR